MWTLARKARTEIRSQNMALCGRETGVVLLKNARGYGNERWRATRYRIEDLAGGRPHPSADLARLAQLDYYSYNSRTTPLHALRPRTAAELIHYTFLFKSIPV